MKEILTTMKEISNEMQRCFANWGIDAFGFMMMGRKCSEFLKLIIISLNWLNYKSPKKAFPFLVTKKIRTWNVYNETKSVGEPVPRFCINLLNSKGRFILLLNGMIHKIWGRE